jgi:predicted patatin/cPLA2 family phospholipase
MWDMQHSCNGNAKEQLLANNRNKTGKDLIICATNALNMKATYFSVNTTPNVLVIDAVRASCAIPLIIKPVKIGDTYYIDGCITDDLPIKIIPKNIPKDNILIMSLRSCDLPETKELSLPLLITNILSTIISNPALINIYEKNYKYYIPIKDIPINSVNYIIENDNMYLCEDIESMNKCFELGYKTMYLKIKEWTQN